jgi:hypothetical protein
MPYTHKKIGDEECVFLKSTGKKVGCTKGNIDKYLAALHANVNESINENIEKKDIINFTVSLENSKLAQKGAHTNTEFIKTVNQIVTMSEQDFSEYIKNNPNEKVKMIRVEFNDWKQSNKPIKESENEIDALLSKIKNYRIPYKAFNQKMLNEYIPMWKEEYGDVAKINEMVARFLLYQISQDLFGGVEEIEFANESKNPTNHFQMRMYLGEFILWTNPFVFVDNKHRVIAKNSKIIILNSDYDDVAILKENELCETKQLIKKLLNKKLSLENKHQISEDDRKKYLNWKRKNITLRGISDSTDENGYNGAGASFGDGLYTAFLSNKSLAKGYGKVYYVLNAIPKHPKIVDSWNNAEIFTQNVVNNWCKKNNLSYNPHEFYSKTNLKDEMLRLGYDGLIIKGREMVNYTPPDNIVYFKNENELYSYFKTINIS